MNETTMKQGGANPLQDARAFVAELMMQLGTIQQMLEENAQLKERVATLEAENAALTETIDQWKKGDEWSSRVTYENVVEQIAACEDAKERDEEVEHLRNLCKVFA